VWKRQKKSTLQAPALWFELCTQGGNIFEKQSTIMQAIVMSRLTFQTRQQKQTKMEKLNGKISTEQISAIKLQQMLRKSKRLQSILCITSFH